MQIQPQFMTLNQLLSGRLFKIPEYQRAYSWGAKQRDDLFSDIRKVRGGDTGHFMATMVGLRRKTIRIAADAFTELEVVDGQQRLTTITLLLRALEKKLTDGDSTAKKLAADLASLLVKGDDLSLLLLQTNHDSSHIFVDYVRDGRKPDRVSVCTSADQNLFDAILQCEAFVAEWAEEGGCVDLLAIIRNQLFVIFHEIDNESLVYTVFEVLNSRGLDVTWFDKMKAMLMAVVFEHGDAGGKAGTIEELHSIWKDIYRTIGVRQTLNRETLRFAASLRADEMPRRPLSEEDAVAELMRQCGDSPKKAVALSKWILRVSEAEDRLLGNHRLRAVSQIVQARLVAISIMLRKFAGPVEKRLLETWESVTFRIYGIANRDARTAVGDYVRLAWAILNSDLPEDDVHVQLKSIAKDVVSLQEAVEKLRAVDLYTGRAETVRYLLYRYDEFLAQKAGQKLNESQWNKVWADEPSKSIEHIKPQSSGLSYVHHLGNLTLLPPGTNSKLKDKDPRDKATTYETCGLLGTVEVARLVKKGTWSAKSVREREAGLIRWALAAWKD
jgi:hypothetical protein